MVIMSKQYKGHCKTEKRNEVIALIKVILLRFSNTVLSKYFPIKMGARTLVR